MIGKTITLTQGVGKPEYFPDFPPRKNMPNWLYLYDSSTLASLAIHFADEPIVTVASEFPVGPCVPVRNSDGIPYLLVVRAGDREFMKE